MPRRRSFRNVSALRAWHWAVLSLIAVIIVVSCFLHQSKGNGWDFYAYYKAAKRFLAGEPFYVFETIYAYKYAPLTIFYFLPFAPFPYDVARWIFAVLHAGAALCIPWLAWGLVRDEKGKAEAPRFATGVCLGALASLRFIDAEFRASNVGMFMAVGMLLGVWALKSSRPRWRFFGPTILGLGAMVKVHALGSFLSFRWTDRRTLAALGTAAAIFLLPHPGLWLDWWRQMQNTGGAMPLGEGAYFLQGFYFFAMHFLGWDPHSLRCLLLAVPFGVGALWLLPRFSLEQARERPASFFLVFGSWTLLALMASPLPWQHTYSFVWALFPMAWAFARGRERGFLATIAALLGLTPLDLIGRPAMQFLEGNQSVFLTVLAFWLGLVFQLSRRSTLISRTH